MWSDIVDLRDFYGSPFGRLAQQLIGRRLREIWPVTRGQRLLGLGFATPFLGAFCDEAERVVAIMPSGQGVLRWPDQAPNLTALADGHALPLPDRSIDRLLVVHCLESSDHLRPMIRECWRVLADGGRLLVVVANRRGLWARAEASPFAQGRPYSMTQITRLLRDNLFVPSQTATALFAPPMWRALFQGWAMALDNVGARWFPTFAGALLVEAEKQIYAAPFDAVPAKLATGKATVRTAGNGVRRAASESAQTKPAR
jgi:SAM-dependent methyltransferase